MNASGFCRRKRRVDAAQRVNAYNLNQLQLFQILIEFYSSIDRIGRYFYLYSPQLYLAYLAAVQSLCAKRGPNKKRGPQCLGSGDRGRDWPLSPSWSD